MLDSGLAQKLVNKISKQFGYNINVMDDRGVIIASADSSRIGAFHQGAYSIIRDRIPLRSYKDVDDSIIGVKPGIIMTTFFKNTVIGVVGVTGDPDVLMPFAKLVKLTFETMYEYELQKENAIKAKVRWDSFVNCLIYEEPRNVFRIRKLSEDAGFEEKYQRIPIIIKYEMAINSDKMIRDMKNLPLSSQQDIIFSLDANRLIVFKVISGLSISETKRQISSYADQMDLILKKSEDTDADNNQAVTFFIGTLQAHYEHYNKAYSHAVWLESFLENRAQRMNYFLDYLMEYNASQLSSNSLEEIFGLYKKNLKKSISKELFIETCQAFLECNMNLDATAEKLFVHRNTVVFRLKKIKRLFGIEPVKNMGDAAIMFYLLYFYKYCI